VKQFVNLLLILIASLLLNSACGNSEKKGSAEEESTISTYEDEKDDKSNEVDEDKSTDIDSSSKDKATDTKKDNNPNKGINEKINLQNYKPVQKGKRTYQEDGQDIYFEEVIASNEEYIQMLVTLGGSQTTEIYKWDEAEISLVFQDHSLENHTKNILDEFEGNMEEEIIVGKNATWEMIEESKELMIGNNNFKDVIVVRSTVEEVAGSTTTKTRYYAPKHGLILEEVEITGENSFKTKYTLKQ
jgi:hypothetical protein